MRSDRIVNPGMSFLLDSQFKGTVTEGSTLGPDESESKFGGMGEREQFNYSLGKSAILFRLVSVYKHTD